MNKREFMLGGAALAGGVAAASGLASRAGTQPMPSDPLGIQFFTIVSNDSPDPPEVYLQKFEAVKKIGYSHIQLSGLHGNTVEAARKRAEALGMRITSLHMGQDISRAFMAPKEDAPPNQIGGAIHDIVFTDKGCIQVARACLGQVRDLGCEWGVMSASSKDCFASIDAVKRLADAFNVCNDLAKKKGLKFSYHGHSIDFTPINGQVPFDILVENTEPDLRYELDIYWCARGGADPLKVIEKHKKRLGLFHLKDMAKDGSIATPGDGVIDFAAVHRATADIPGRLFYVERDNGKDPILEASRAAQFLRTKGFT